MINFSQSKWGKKQKAKQKSEFRKERDVARESFLDSFNRVPAYQEETEKGHPVFAENYSILGTVKFHEVGNEKLEDEKQLIMYQNHSLRTERSVGNRFPSD